MIFYYLLMSLVCIVCGGPLGKQKTSEILYDEVYINSLKESLQRSRPGETELENVDDYAVQQGDILIPTDRNAVSDLWPKEGEDVSVPYAIDSVIEDRTNVITDALKMISEKTCIKFHLRTNESNYLYFIYEKGCASYVGFLGGEQPILVGPQCRVGNICHEILHALGLHHEHSRADRGKQITILYENITPGKEENFRVKDGNTLGLKYDLESILHYGSNYFSHNGKPTILPKDSNVKIGQRERLSDLDVQKIRALYNCDRRETII